MLTNSIESHRTRLSIQRSSLSMKDERGILARLAFGEVVDVVEVGRGSGGGGIIPFEYYLSFSLKTVPDRNVFQVHDIFYKLGKVSVRVRGQEMGATSSFREYRLIGSCEAMVTSSELILHITPPRPTILVTLE